MNRKRTARHCWPLLLVLLAAGAWAESKNAQPLVSELLSASRLPLVPCVLITDMESNAGSVLAVGAGGHIFKRKTPVNDAAGLPCESAAYWQLLPSPVLVPLTTLSINGKHAWAAGHDGVILHSGDGGGNWEIQYRLVNAEFPVTFLDSLFLNDQRGFVVGAHSAFAQTSNGGESWVYRILDKEIEGHLHAITRLGDGALLVVGAGGTVYTSVDEGVNWQWDDDFPYEGSMFTALPFGEKGILVAGVRGHVFIKRDWQESDWQLLPPVTDRTLFSAAMRSNGEVLLGGAGGQLLTTVGGISRLEVLPSRANGMIADFLFTEQTLLIAGEHGVQHSP